MLCMDSPGMVVCGLESPGSVVCDMKDPGLRGLTCSDGMVWRSSE